MLQVEVCFLCTDGALHPAWLLPAKKRADFSSKCKKALFLQCHKVVIAVKLIYGTGLGNDVMDGLELMESLPNSIKPPYVATLFHLTYKRLFSYNALT